MSEHKTNLFLRYKALISEASKFLDESFDKPYDMKRVHIPEDELNAIHSHNVENYEEYELHDGRAHENSPSKMTVYKRNGAYEIHHEIGDGRSGEMVSTGKPNPRFVATMFHHAKKLIDSGNSVRIVGHKENGMFDHYHRIGKALARKHGYVIGNVSSHSENSPSDIAHKFHTFNVSKAYESVYISDGSRSGSLNEIHLAKTYIGKL
jgi:hypothetical protein